MSETHAPGPGVARHYLHEHEDLHGENPDDGQVPVWNESAQSFDFGSPAGGLGELWIPGSSFAGNASGFGSPGGAGAMAAVTFTSGANSYAMADVPLPADWSAFTAKLYASTADANTAHDFIFEVTYQLLDAGDTLDGTLNPQTVTFDNAGADALSIGTLAIDNAGGATFFQIKVRSNNATQGLTGAAYLLGVGLTKA